MDVWTTDDPQAFLDRAGAHLAAEPVLTNVIAVVAERMTRGTYTWDDPWFATVEQDGAVVAAGMHTAPNAYTGPGRTPPGPSWRRHCSAPAGRRRASSGSAGRSPASPGPGRTPPAARRG